MAIALSAPLSSRANGRSWPKWCSGRFKEFSMSGKSTPTQPAPSVVARTAAGGEAGAAPGVAAGAVSGFRHPPTPITELGLPRHPPHPAVPLPRHDGRGARMRDDWPLQSYLELGVMAGSVPCARLHAKHVLWEWGLAEISDSVELLVSELVTNAVREGYSFIITV